MGKLEKQIKQLVEELKKNKKKKGKKKPKKQRKVKKSLAEYAKEKMMLDAYQKSLGGGGGAPPIVPRPTVSLDTENVKSELNQLKEKIRTDKSQFNDEVKRLESGLEQYKNRLAIEHEEKIQPRAFIPQIRSGIIGDDGEMITMERVGEIYNELQAQLIGMNSKIASLDAQMSMADEADVPEIEQQKQEVEELKQELEEVQHHAPLGNMTVAQMIEYERMAQRFLRDQRAKYRGAPVASTASSSAASSSPSSSASSSSVPTYIPTASPIAPEFQTSAKPASTKPPARRSVGSKPTTPSAPAVKTAPAPKRLGREVASLGR